jgi:hypothetical protein
MRTCGCYGTNKGIVIFFFAYSVKQSSEVESREELDVRFYLGLRADATSLIVTLYARL